MADAAPTSQQEQDRLRLRLLDLRERELTLMQDEPAAFAAPVPAAPQTPAAPPGPTNRQVAGNAFNKGIAATIDSLVNAPNEVLNLGKAAAGTVATALGRPDLAPDLTDNPDYVRKALISLKAIDPNMIPQGFVQKLIDVAGQGAGGGALTGGLGFGKAMLGAGMGALSSTAAAGAEDVARKQGAPDLLAKGAGLAAGALGPQGVSMLAGRLPKALATRTPDIPPERVDAYKAMTAAGARPSGQSLVYGQENTNVKGQQRVANEIYNEAVGLPKKSDFGEHEFKLAKEKSTADYRRVLGGQEVTLDRTLAQEMKAMYDKQLEMNTLGPEFREAKPIIDTMGKLLEAGEAHIKIPAEDYNKMRSMLGRDAHASRSDPSRAMEYIKVQKALDDAADRSLPPKVAKELKDVRGRYENLMILSGAALGKESGFITPENIGKEVAKREGFGSLYPTEHPLKQLGKQGMSLGGGSAQQPGINFSGVAKHAQGLGLSLNALERALYSPYSALKARALASPTFGEDAARRAALLKESAKRAVIPAANELATEQPDNP